MTIGRNMAWVARIVVDRELALQGRILRKMAREAHGHEIGARFFLRAAGMSKP